MRRVVPQDSGRIIHLTRRLITIVVGQQRDALTHQKPVEFHADYAAAHDTRFAEESRPHFLTAYGPPGTEA